MIVRPPLYSQEEFARRGKEIYESQVRPQVEENRTSSSSSSRFDWGKFISMIIGNVNANREAIIQIAVLGDYKNIKSVKAVIDTGYTGDLMLSRAIINELGLTLRGLQDAILGDGSLTMFEMYAGSVIWDGQIRRAEINASETELLIGMGLLEEYKLEIEGRVGGIVKISAL